MLKPDIPHGTWALFDDGTHRRFYSSDKSSWPLTISSLEVLTLAKLLPTPNCRQEAGYATPSDRHKPCVTVDTSDNIVKLMLGRSSDSVHVIWSKENE